MTDTSKPGVNADQLLNVTRIPGIRIWVARNGTRATDAQRNVSFSYAGGCAMLLNPGRYAAAVDQLDMKRTAIPSPIGMTNELD